MRKETYDKAIRQGPAFGKSMARRDHGSRPGKTIRCPRCEETAESTRKFCSRCGTALWEACYQCGALAAADERFCGDCGADLVAGLHEQQQRFADALGKARRLHQRNSYADAVALLTPIAAAKHSKLAEYARAAEELIRQCVRDGEAATREAADTLEQARQLISDCRYEEAVSKLAAVATALRSDATNALLHEARSQMREVAALQGELKVVEAGAFDRGVIEKTGRLLSLDPKDPIGVALADRIRRRLTRAAGERLAQGKYQQVRSFLDQVPSSLRDAELDALRDRAEDLHWLRGRLHDSPVADATLLELGKRYVALAAGDAESSARVAELERRLADARPDPAHAVLPWAPRAARAGQSCEPEWLTGFRRVAPPSAAPVVATLHAQPGCFFVACGLALQGLGLAAVETNLMPEDRGGLLQRMAQLMTRRIGAAKTAWGLDLSASGLKALRLAAGSGASAAPSMEDAAWLEHRKPLHQAGSPVEERTLIAETIDRFLETHNVAGDRVCLGLSNAAVMLRDVRVPIVSPRKQAAVLEHQVRMLFPIPESELLWDYALFEEPTTAQDRPKEATVKLAAVRKHPLVERMAVLGDHGLHVDVWQSDCVALHNFLQYDGGVNFPASATAATSQPTAPGGVTVAMDIGCDATSVVFSGPQTLWFRTSAIGAHRINRALVQRFGLTFAQSEQWKRQPHLAPSPRALYASGFEPVFEDYLHDVQEAMQSFRAKHPQGSIDRVVGVGGGWLAHGLLQYVLEQTAGELAEGSC